jgi:hypothetical protein
VLDECCGDGRGSYVVRRIDGTGSDKFSVGKYQGNFIHENEKKRRKDNGNFSYEHEAKSESDVAGAVARGTQGAVEEGEGIYEDA